MWWLCIHSHLKLTFMFFPFIRPVYLLSFGRALILLLGTIRAILTFPNCEAFSFPFWIPCVDRAFHPYLLLLISYIELPQCGSSWLLSVLAWTSVVSRGRITCCLRAGLCSQTKLSRISSSALLWLARCASVCSSGSLEYETKPWKESHTCWPPVNEWLAK